jgi:hypothetical protein
MFYMVRPSGTRYCQGLYGKGRDMTSFKVGDVFYAPLEATEHDEEMQMYVD